MSLIPVNEMNILKTASEAREVAESAIHDQQLSQVALAINTAANCGDTRCTYSSGKLLDSVLQVLKNNNYEVIPESGDRSASYQYTISFKKG